MGKSSRIKDHINKTFGRLTVLGLGAKNDKGRQLWLCQCSCGNTTDVIPYSLKNGDTSSCGCLEIEARFLRHEKNRNDKLGKRYNRLLVVEVDKINKDGTFFKCQCDCGNTTSVRGAYLVSGKTKSCGCLGLDQLQKRNDLHKEYMIGRRFGRLIVLKNTDDKSKFTRYLCQCDCGNQTTVNSFALKCGNTQSCGCYAKECQKARATTHGLSRFRLYRIWNGIIQRCENRNTEAYGYYGEKGIFLCSEWRNNFRSFYEWAIQNGYSDKLSIDRYPDRHGPYCPENCRWVDRFEQSRNRDIVKLTPEKAEMIRGDSRTQVEIAQSYGVSQGTISNIKLNKIWRT